MGICLAGFARSGIVYRGRPCTSTSKIGNCPGMARTIGLARVPEKNAANSWNCSRFQESVLWSWHWAHWICTPRKIREISPASSTGLASWASARLAAPFSSTRPVAVIIARGDLIPGLVLLELLGQPVFQRVVPHLQSVLVGGVEADHVLPVVCPVAGIRRALQESFDQSSPLVFRLIVDEGENLRRGSAVRPARSRCTRPDELDVTGQRGWFDLGIRFLEVLPEQPVQLRGGQGRRCDRTCRPLGQGSLCRLDLPCLVALITLLDRGSQLLQRLQDFGRRLLIKQLLLLRSLGLLVFLRLLSQQAEAHRERRGQCQRSWPTEPSESSRPCHDVSPGLALGLGLGLADRPSFATPFVIRRTAIQPHPSPLGIVASPRNDAACQWSEKLGPRVVEKSREK